jgi:hypothetical protein
MSFMRALLVRSLGSDCSGMTPSATRSSKGSFQSSEHCGGARECRCPDSG